ncbi:porin [Noviherbaspirillum denitrificans]|uniref:Porin domain-containing protein n=1 Tax=Noviherbaspirillum denitrificans TaxID=1968433 RepID=A0A254TG83_9BURK|nr:porin [Noviherbaspirillum denitrificans]OWW21177.1 hypothetical protein AYR66_18550 [Noviherbaspirillum denitrificans]
MKKALLAAAVTIAFSNAASAQSNLSVYGIVDQGVEYLTNANPAGDSLVRMPSLTGTLPSRLGFKGVEDLGGGFRTLFVLESGFAMTTGAVGYGNRLFGRLAYVGLGGPWGTLMLGRQLTMTAHGLGGADVIGPSIHGLGVLDAYIPNARSDNSIGYLGSFSGLTLGATYSLGRDSSAAGGPAGTNCPDGFSGNARACRQWTAMAKYDATGFGIAGTMDRMHGGPGAAAGLSNSSYTDTRTQLNGYAMIGPVKLGAGWLGRETKAATNSKVNLFFIDASYPWSSQLTVDILAARRDVRNSPNDSTLLVARTTYALSKRTAVYASLGHIDNDGAATQAASAGAPVGAGMSQLGVMTGIRHTF